MFEQIRDILREYGIWIFLLLLAEAGFSYFLWLSQPEAFEALCLVMIPVFLLLTLSGILFCLKRERKRMKNYGEWLKNPQSLYRKNLLLGMTGRERKILDELLCLLDRQSGLLEKAKQEQNEYETYIDTWAHEIKTPLALTQLLLENHPDEIPDTLRRRLEYSSRQIQAHLERIICYARLMGSHKDYRMEWVSLKDVVLETASEYRSEFQETGMRIESEIGSAMVYTDRKSLAFLLGQVFQNALKYARPAAKSPLLRIESRVNDGGITLTIWDNGGGVPKNDLPFIFEKGFTGESRYGKKGQKSTGIGLYLVHQLAEDLGICLEAFSVYGEEFRIEFGFDGFRQA